jgi:hypothetical protein
VRRLRSLRESARHQRGNLLRHDDANEPPDWVFGRARRPAIRLRGDDARERGIVV